MANPEVDPTRGIVDIETFVLYLVGYQANIIATRPSRWCKILDYPDLPFTPPDNPRPHVSLQEFPWQDTPESIQDIIALQYPAAAVNEEKSISLWLNIPEGTLSFTLESASLAEGFRAGDYVFDRFAKIVIPSTGLMLALRDNEVAAKGQWIITQRPANQAEIKYVNSKLFNLDFELVTERAEDQIYKAMDRMIRVPIEPERVSLQCTTLQELHDVVRTLVKGREEATWGETLH